MSHSPYLALSSLLTFACQVQLGCVVSDEIHYINDVERGCVWEETLMHLPKEVQMVALSATLREPEKFLHWIGSARGRPGTLARRLDRHVPLHVGGVSQSSGDFVEIFGTHGPGAGVLNAQRFTSLFGETGDAVQLAAKRDQAAASRGERDAEKAAVAARNRGTGAASSGGSGRSGGGKGGGKGGGGRGPQVNYSAECTRVAKDLRRLDMLPVSRSVDGAHSLHKDPYRFALTIFAVVNLLCVAAGGGVLHEPQEVCGGRTRDQGPQPAARQSARQGPRPREGALRARAPSCPHKLAH